MGSDGVVGVGEDAGAAEVPTAGTEVVTAAAEPSVSEAPAESTSLSPEAIEATAASWEVSESEVTDIHDVDDLAELKG